MVSTGTLEILSVYVAPLDGFVGHLGGIDQSLYIAVFNSCLVFSGNFCRRALVIPAIGRRVFIIYAASYRFVGRCSQP